MDDQTRNQIAELLFLALENEITQEQIQTLNSLIKNKPDLIRYAIHYLQINSTLKFSHTVAGMKSADISKIKDSNSLTDIFAQMAEYEKVAPEVEISKEEPKPELIQRVVYPPREKRGLNKFTLFVLLNTAAVILFFVLLNFAPPKAGVKVATLTDSLNAKWADLEGQMANGTPIVTGNKTLLLREGYAELLFDNQTKVTIEGPAEFQILTEDQIKLNYGDLYAIVPREAIGFTIKTPSSQIIDLGTEFGIRADFQGDTALHVMKGKTVLIAGDKSNKVGIEVTGGIAKKVSSHSQTISDISHNDRLFVRQISSTDQLVWRGENAVDLADMIGGGNGFGTGRKGVGIDPASGKLVVQLSMSPRTQTISQYSPVSENPFLDGVFVPLGGDSPQVVTSAGDVFDQCPKTDGLYWVEITNNPITGFQGEPETTQLARLNGIEYGTDMHPAIMMHANTGITFDLEAIRSVIPSSTQIRRFTSSCGLSETLDGTALQKDASAEMWILIDGQPREKVHVDFADKSYAFVTVDINESDRFLTLISCSDWNAGDWTLYGDPVLELELND